MADSPKRTKLAAFLARLDAGQPGPIGDPLAAIDESPRGPERDAARERAFAELNQRVTAFGRSLRRRGLYRYRCEQRPARCRAPRRTRTRRRCSRRAGPRESRAGPDGDPDDDPGGVARLRDRRAPKGALA